MKISLLRREPLVIRQMIGSSRLGLMPWMYCGVVDHHAERLGARPRGGCGDVVGARRGQARERGDVIEQSGEATGH